MDLYSLGYNNFLEQKPLFSSVPTAIQSNFSQGTAPSSLASGDTSTNLQLVDGHLQSKDFLTLIRGWIINANGDVEFNAGNFRGDITGASGSFSGTIAASAINIGGTDATSWHVDLAGNMWWGDAGSYTAATIKISSVGSVDFTTGNFSGTLVAPSGTLGALTIASGGNIKFGKTAYTDDTNAGLWLGDVSGVAKLNIGVSTTKYLHYDGSDLSMLGGVITGGTIQTAASGYRTVLNSSNILFYADAVQKGFIRPDSGKSIVIGSADDFYFTDLAGTPYFKMNSNGNFDINGANKKINFTASGRYLYDASSRIETNGGFSSNSDNVDDLGVSNKRWATVYGVSPNFSGSGNVDGTLTVGTVQGNHKSSDGTSGVDSTIKEFVTTMRYDSGAIEFKTRSYTFKDGLMTAVGGESGWNRT